MASLFKTIYDEQVYPIHSIRSLEELQNCIVLGFECCLLGMDYRSYHRMTFISTHQHHNGVRATTSGDFTHYINDLGIPDPTFNTNLGFGEIRHLFPSFEDAKAFVSWLDYGVLHQRDPPW